MEFIIQDALKMQEENEKASNIFPVGQANIKVVGIGGGGGNATSWLYKKGIQGAEVIAVNTDKQHLDVHEADKKILVGKDITKGLGAGGYPNVARDAAKESITELKESIKGSDMVFVCAGLGGGTGTGIAPVIAQVAREIGAIVVGTVTMPFNIERARIDKAEFGLQQLRQVCDSVIVIDNNRLVNIAGNLPIGQAFAVANELISTMIKGIVETIAIPSLVNLDYADVRAIMKSGGVCAVGVGESDRKDARVEEAVRRAMNNPLLDVSYEGAGGALIHVSGGPDLTLEEVSKIGELVTQGLDPDANVIWGARVDDSMRGKLRVMTIVAGVNSPYILGKTDPTKPSQEIRAMSRELGIDLL